MSQLRWLLGQGYESPASRRGTYCSRRRRTEARVRIVEEYPHTFSEVGFWEKITTRQQKKRIRLAVRKARYNIHQLVEITRRHLLENGPVGVELP